MTKEELNEIADRLEQVLTTLRHKGFKDRYVMAELDDIIDDLTTEK